MEEPIVLAVNAKHRFATRQSVAMTTLRDEPIIVFPRWPRPSFADEVVRFCDQAGFIPYIAQEAEDFSACIALVSAGMGMAPVPASAANVQIADTRFVRIVRPVPTSCLSCVYRKDDGRTQLQAFLRTMREVRIPAYVK